MQVSPTTREELNIPYVSGGGDEQQLDLYIPEERDFSTIIFVHGGSLTSEDRNDTPYVAMCRTFQHLGIAVANINYRLAPVNKWPAMPEDVASVFAWVKKNIASRGGNPDQIFLFGHSSGCHLVALIASDMHYLQNHGESPADIAGVISMGCMLNYWDTTGVGFSPERWKTIFESDRDETNIFGSLHDRIAANPSLYIGGHMPPILVLVAEAERFQPPILEQGAIFVRKSREAGVDADIEILKDRKHYSAVRMLVSPDDPTLNTIIKFIYRVIHKTQGQN